MPRSQIESRVEKRSSVMSNGSNPSMDETDFEEEFLTQEVHETSKKSPKLNKKYAIVGVLVIAAIVVAFVMMNGGKKGASPTPTSTGVMSGGCSATKIVIGVVVSALAALGLYCCVCRTNTTTIAPAPGQLKFPQGQFYGATVDGIQACFDEAVDAPTDSGSNYSKGQKLGFTGQYSYQGTNGGAAKDYKGYVTLYKYLKNDNKCLGQAGWIVEIDAPSKGMETNSQSYAFGFQNGNFVGVVPEQSSDDGGKGGLKALCLKTTGGTFAEATLVEETTDQYECTGDNECANLIWACAEGYATKSTEVQEQGGDGTYQLQPWAAGSLDSYDPINPSTPKGSDQDPKSVWKVKFPGVKADGTLSDSRDYWNAASESKTMPTDKKCYFDTTNKVWAAPVQVGGTSSPPSLKDVPSTGLVAITA